MIPERFAFIFAITIPFDIRDLEVEEENEVKTIPGMIGVDQSIVWSIRLLAVSLLFATANWTLQEYTTTAYLGICLSILVTIPMVLASPKAKHDYYFTGLMDGTMLIQALAVFLLSSFL